MHRSSSSVFDMIGIGFGPSNIALAIALDEAKHFNTSHFSYCFVERQEAFSWHPGMLIPSSDMQISFIKDLVSLRNPMSPFTFINYLRQCNRLEAFINRKTFFPSRIEFNDYLRWVAKHFSDQCHYGENVSYISPEYNNSKIDSLQVFTHDKEGREIVRRAKSLVLGMGGMPYVPSLFSQANDDRIIHSSNYLHAIPFHNNHLDKPFSIAVIGAGQSAAEILLDLYEKFPRANIDLIMRGSALKPSEDGSSINTIFDPTYIDYFYSQSAEVRKCLLQEFRHTNYAAVDSDLIEKINTIIYEQEVVGKKRMRLLTNTDIHNVKSCDQHIGLDFFSKKSTQQTRGDYKFIVLATGYTRKNNYHLLKGLDIDFSDANIDRNYRLKTPDHFSVPIFIQGASENTHGLADTLLSVLAIRSKEIAEALINSLKEFDDESKTSNVFLRNSDSFIPAY